MPSQSPFTVDTVLNAIPLHGITVAGLALKFSQWVSTEEGFEHLMFLAKRVALLDVDTITWFRKNMPTTAEVLLAIPREGINLDCFMIKFSWPELPHAARRRIVLVLDRIARLDERTMDVRLRGRLTVQDVIDAIPNEGTTLEKVFHKFKTRFGRSFEEESGNLIVIFSLVTEKDASIQRVFVREEYRVTQ